ncbi:MAG: type II toxin-antitoxin system prevent-host-death family antitoxin [Chthoniobacterales bacterium]
MIAALNTLNIKELHANTGQQVRRVSKSRHPITITDRGKSVAMLVSVDFFQKKTRKRTLLPAYAKFMKQSCSHDVLEDLDAVRGDR